MSTVLIAGGGIGGLTAALALAQTGKTVRLFEQAQAFTEVGAGIQLSPNCVRVLHDLGLAQELSNAASRPTAIDIRDWRHGHRITSTKLADRALARYGYPYYHIHRADLLDILLHRLSRYDKVHLHLNARVQTCHDREQEVVVRAGDNEFSGAMLIGADGIHSVVRARLFGDEAPRYTGNVAWRALVPAASLPVGLVEPTATLWWGPGAHFVHYYVRGGELINCVCIVERDAEELESWSHHADPGDLKTEFVGWHRIVRTIIDNIDGDTCFKWGLFDRPPMNTWSRGRITLLGDACHPTLPFMAQGAAMAIEDAAVLAACVDRFDEPRDAFARYERLRQQRTAWVQRSSSRNATIFHMRSPLRWGRNLFAGPAQARIMDRLFAFDPLDVS